MSNSDDVYEVCDTADRTPIPNCHISNEPGVLKPFQYSPLLQTVSALIRGISTNGRDIAVKSLEGLLPRPEIRKTVWAMPVILEG